MCGIIALLRGPGARRELPASSVLTRLDDIQRRLSEPDALDAARAAAEGLEELDALLRDMDGVALLVRDRDLATRTAAVGAAIRDWVAALEETLDSDGALGPHPVEEVNATLLRLKDAGWAVECDRVPTATRVRELVGEAAGWSAVEIATSIQQALAALDRLEVRGRDSAGLTILVRDHDLDLADPAIGRLLAVAPDRPALPVEGRADARGPPQLRLQGGGGDRGARRQHRRHAGRHPGGRPAAARP